MNYFEEAKKFGGSPVPSNTKVDFLEEAKKMGGTPVPAPKVDYFAAAKDFGGAPIPAPTTTAVQNPFAVEGAPIEAPVEKSSLYEFPRALVRGAINLQGIPAGIQQRQYALGMEAPDTALSAFDKIDAGELKSKKDINKFIGGDKSVQDLLSTESLEKGYKSPTSGLRAIGLAKDYLNASPEERKKIRAATQAELQENLQGFGEAVSRGEEIKKQAEPYASRLKDFTDVGGIGDAGTYVASKLGEAIPQFAPVIASGLLFRRPGVIGTSIGMELGPATQDRVDFITEKIKNEPNPEKRSADVAKYVRDSADVTLMAATVSGLFDAVLGPEAEIAKRLLSGELRKQTRKEILTAIPKVAATSGYKEGLTGGLQEIVMINAERKLGEQTGDAFTKENIIRVVDSALSEAIGGFGMSTTIEGARAIRAQKDTAQTATREGEAIRGLDALAEQEERTKAAAEDTTSAAPPTARTLDNLTQQEVEAVQRRLFAELGRPAEEQELLGALNEYVTAQNANLGVESGASVAGVSDTGAEQPAGAAGISDTGAAATSDTGGLGTSGVSTDQLTDRTTEQPSTLDEARAKLAAAEARVMSDPNATVADLDVAQAEYDAVESAEKESVSRIALANADSAFDQVDQYDSLQDAIDSYEQNFFDTLNEEKVTDSFLRDYAYKEFQKRIEELRQAAQPKAEEVIKEEAPAADIFEISALENQERNLFNDIVEIESEQKALLTKAGRIPAKNSPARQKYDKLEEQRTAAVDVWSSASDALRQAKTTQDTGVNIDQVVTENVQELLDTNPDYEVAAYDAQITKLQTALRNLGVTDNKILANAAGKFDEVLMSKVGGSGPALAAAPEGPRVDSIERFPLGPTSIKPKVIAEGQPLYRETNAGGVDDLLRDDRQFTYAPIFVTDNPDLALGQGVNVGAKIEFRPNAVSGEINQKPVPGELTGKEYKADVIAPKAVQRVTFNNARVLNSLSGLAKRILSQNFDKKVLPDGKIEFTRKGAAGPALSPDTTGGYTKQPGETIEEYQERLLTLPKSALAPDIIQLIRNNDLNGALKAIAAKFSGGTKIRSFYGDLANRLAALNLPTEIRIDDARNLIRRSIDSITSAQQVRLFAYLRTTQPEIFEKYFKEYYKDSALESVYAGLVQLNFDRSKKILGPVENEFDDVLKAYDAAMAAMPNAALGAFFPNFDVINLNNNGLNYQVFLHEVVHAATEILLRTPSSDRTAEQDRAIEELERLYNIAKDNIKVKEYGLTNLSEFIAEVFTNSNFQSLLKNIPYAPAKTNVFRRFIQSIMNLVGLDNVAGRAMVEAEKLFSVERPRALTSAGPRFMAAKKKRVRGPISTPDTYRTANENQNTLLGVIKDAASGQMQWSDARKILIPAVWEAANVNTRKSLLYVANLTQLEDITRTKFSQLTGALKIIRDMVAYRAKKLNTASDITRRWVAAQSKNYNQSQLMGRVMLEATIRGIDPDTAQAGTLNKPLQDAWNTLNPEFKQIYRDVRNFYTDSVNEMIREMKLRANQITDSAQRAELLRKIDAQFGPDKLIKPYFPMRRFGQYWFQVGSGNFKEFYEFESPVAREIAMRKRIAQLSKGNKQQQALADTIRKGNGISELYGQNRGTTQVLNDVNELVQNISATDVADLKVQLEDSLNQLVYLLLPQQSMRKMFINRKAIQGASADMLRVFATSAVHSAYQQARFKFAEGFLTNLNNARDEIDGAEKAGALDRDQAAVYRDFIAEVENRVPTIMSNEDTSFVAQAASKASELTFYYMLSAPFTAMLNNIGAVQIAMPYLGGTYGYAKANAVLLKNLGRYFATVPSRTFAPLKTGQVMQVNFPSIVEGGKLDPLMQRAADRFLDDGQIDISMTNDIMDLGGRPSEMYTGTNANIKKAMSGLFHQSERLNREVFLLSTFELAYEKYLNDFQRQPGMEGLKGVYLRDAQGNRIKNTPDQAFELAIEEATRTAALTLGDYSRQMKGRVFANPVMNVLLKFKQYPIMAMYAVWRNFHLGAIAPFQKAELDQYRALLERELSNDPNKDAVIEQRMQEVEAQRKDMHKEGRRRLAGILGMSTLLGGVAATPFFSLVIGPLVKMFGNDDDDEFFDWENWFYNYMETEFGGYAAAMLTSMGMEEDTAEKAGRTIGEVTARGLPTLAGAALSERVSLDPKNLLWRDGRYSPDVRENVIETMIANAGPVVGLALNFADAAQLVKEGQYARAAEKLLPAIIAKPVSAARMSEEGARTKGGDVLLNDLTATELAMQAIGLQPDRLAQKQKAAVAMKQKEQKIKDQRSAIMNRLWLERDNPEGFSDALDRAIEFSVKHPGLAISGDKINKSFQKRARRAAEVEVYGADIDKKLRPELMDMGDFADDE